MVGYGPIGFGGTRGRGQNSLQGGQYLSHSLLDPENDTGTSNRNSGREAVDSYGTELDEGEGFGLGGVLDEYEREDATSLGVVGGRAGAMRRVVRGTGESVPWSPVRAARVRAFEGTSYDPLSTTEEGGSSGRASGEEPSRGLVVMGAGERVVREQEMIEPRVQSLLELDSQTVVTVRELAESGEEEKRSDHDSLI